MAATKDDPNVVAQLKQRLAQIRKMGFKVRIELLDGEQGSWCEIAGVPTLFVDLSQTTVEQLQQVNETMEAWRLAPSSQKNPTSTEAVGQLAKVKPAA